MELLSANEFRQKLAGIGTEVQDISEKEIEDAKQWCIEYCATLPRLYSDDLDRKTMWDRIGNAVVSSVKKSGGDFEEFINLSLEFVKADPGKLVSNVDLNQFIEMTAEKSPEWKQTFLRLFEKKHHVILVYARQWWNERKAK